MMSRLERGILKFKGKHSEYGEYLVVSDGKGKIAFMGVKKILKTHPENPQQWQDTLFMVDDKSKGLQWRDEKKGYFKAEEYKKNTKPIPKPIPQEFMDLYSNPYDSLVQETSQEDEKPAQAQKSEYVFIPRKKEKQQEKPKEEPVSSFISQGDGSMILLLTSIKEDVGLMREGMKFLAQYLKSIVELLSAQLSVFSKNRDLDVDNLMEDFDLDNVPKL